MWIPFTKIQNIIFKMIICSIENDIKLNWDITHFNRVGDPFHQKKKFIRKPGGNKVNGYY